MEIRMALPIKYQFTRRIIGYEIIGLAIIVLIIWLDELIDIPYLFLGAENTRVNWKESLFETACILVLGVLVIHYTYKLFKRMKHLEGILPVCAACKKIRDENGNWHAIESFISEKSDAKFSHGVCPECAEKLYPDYNPYKKKPI